MNDVLILMVLYFLLSNGSSSTIVHIFGLPGEYQISVSAHNALQADPVVYHYPTTFVVQQIPESLELSVRTFHVFHTPPPPPVSGVLCPFSLLTLKRLGLLNQSHNLSRSLPPPPATTTTTTTTTTTSTTATTTTSTTTTTTTTTTSTTTTTTYITTTNTITILLLLLLLLPFSQELMRRGACVHPWEKLSNLGAANLC